jgi:hypothetical protein
LTFSIFDGHPVETVITTRAGGVSEGPYESLNLGLHVGDDPGRVLENRRRAAGLLRAELDDLVFCEQAHARTVAVLTESDRGRGARSTADAVKATDALVTAEEAPVLVTMVADCVPIALYDPDAHVLACVHAGWGGTVQRVVDVALEAMRGLGASPARVLAGLGPAIGAETYQVGPDVRDRALAGFGGQVDDLLRVDPGTPDRWLFDLHAANTRILREAGVPEANIELMLLSTGADGRLFSDRDERPCGRFALMGRLRQR